jgi:hypothetical protein
MPGIRLVTPYVWPYEHTLLLLPQTLLFAWLDDRKWAWLVYISGTVIVRHRPGAKLSSPYREHAGPSEGSPAIGVQATL